MSSVAIIRDDRYLEHNAGEGHPESPNRLLVLHDLIDKEFASLPLITPRFATHEELALVHDVSYITWVAGTHGKFYTQLDSDTGLSARSYDTARLAAGALLQAVDSLLTPTPLGLRVRYSPSSPTVIMPSEARHGFCLFNNAAVAAECKTKFDSSPDRGLGPSSRQRHPATFW
jgi:acetoin utilization deacetylase AcuC-like enzyme